MAVRTRGKAASRRRKELLAGVAALSVILLALIIVAVVLFNGEAPQQAAKMVVPPLPTLPQRQPNPYQPADYLWDGERMTLADGRGIAGIDVSRHQGEIDWQQVAASGVRFVFIRIGYRTYGDGTITEDTFAQANYRGAREAGLKIGVYFFSQAVNLYEALEEAQWTLDALQGWELDLPVVYDWEIPADDARTRDVTAGQVTAYTRVFNRVMAENGYQSMIYFNGHQAREGLHMHRLTDVAHWFAKYSPEMDYGYGFAIWQYSQTGRVPGIQGNVDLNLMLPGQSFWEEEK